MPTFQKVKLGDIAMVIMGQSPASEFYNQDGNGLPFFQGVKDFGEKYPTETSWSTITPKVAEKGDVLFSVRAPVGELNIANKKCCIGRGVAAIRSINNQADYLYFLLKSYIEKIKSFGNGSVYDAVNKDTLEKIIVDVFSDSKTQTRIASVLSAYDDLIENNEKRIKALEEMAQLLYTEWFVKFNFHGHEKVTMIDSHTKYGMIPTGWEVKKLDEVASFVRGCSYSSEEIDDFSGDYYMINLKSFNRGGGFRFDGAKYFSGTINNNQLLTAGDITVAVTDMTNNRAVIARPARVPELAGEITLSADVVKINSDTLPSSFLYELLSSHRFTETTKQKANGANVLHLKPAAILEFLAIIPDTKSLEEFDVFCKPTINEVDKLMKQNDVLTKTRDLLIPQLVTGRRELK